LKAEFGTKDIRQIDAGDIQRLIARLTRDGREPKTIRNLWGTISLIWQAALAQKYVDSTLPKPKLPKAVKKAPRFFRLEDAARIIASVQVSRDAFIGSLPKLAYGPVRSQDFA
jgi:integrase